MDFRINRNALSGLYLSLICALLCGALPSYSQERVTTLGIQFKPMIPSVFFGTSAEVATNGEFTAEFTPRIGHNFGMVVRHGFTKMWSLETGISLVQRNYYIDYTVPDLQQKQRLSFRFIGYEIPVQGLIYVRLGKQLWMNASGGLSLDMYPSDVLSRSSIRQDTLVFDFYQDTFRRKWIQLAVLANYGFEWRTKESGFFYLGASFHRPFQEIAYTKASLDINTNPSSLVYPLSGSYLTVDVRYFFHEDPEKKVKKMRKSPG